MDRKAELQKIERSLTEVRDMFIRIANLVVEQVYNFVLNRVKSPVNTISFNILFVESINSSGGIPCTAGHVKY